MENKIIYRAQYLGKAIKHSNGNVDEIGVIATILDSYELNN